MDSQGSPRSFSSGLVTDHEGDAPSVLPASHVVVQCAVSIGISLLHHLEQVKPRARSPTQLPIGWLSFSSAPILLSPIYSQSVTVVPWESKQDEPGALVFTFCGQIAVQMKEASS